MPHTSRPCVWGARDYSPSRQGPLRYQNPGGARGGARPDLPRCGCPGRASTRRARASGRRVRPRRGWLAVF